MPVPLYCLTSAPRSPALVRCPTGGGRHSCINDPTVSIRAYSAQDVFKRESLDRIDKFSRPARTFYNLNRWISIRIDIIGALFSSGLAAYLVYGTGAIHRPGHAAAIGFSLNMAVGFSSMILWWVRILNEFEVSGNRWVFLNKLAGEALTSLQLGTYTGLC